MKKLFLPILILFVLSCNNTDNKNPQKAVEEKKSVSNIVLHPEWTESLTKNKLSGSVHIWNKNEDTWHHSDSASFHITNVPASTFKIFISLTALELGTIRDENEVLKWNGTKQQVASWNHDQDMREAFANSTNWFYEKLATDIGSATMKTWLDRANYSCNSIDGKEKYWLEPGFEISPEKQIDFLRRLHDNELPFAQRNMDITKNIMFAKDTLGVKIYAKTGWAVPNNFNIGWYVGWAEKNNSIYYFATCIENPEPEIENFGDLRISTIYNALTSMGVLSISSK